MLFIDKLLFTITLNTYLATNFNPKFIYMKNYLIAIAFIFVGATAANAQDYKPFKLGLGLGYTQPTDGGGGVLFDIEPAYRINDDIAVGLRIESAAMAKVAGNSEAKVSASGSYTVNGQYYLGDSKVRPYAGLGFGIYSIASADVSFTQGSEGMSIGGGSKFGFYPRVGLDIGHFNINIDYNIVSTIKETYTFDGSTEPTEVEMKNSYIGFRIGAFIFGGKN